MPRRALLWLLLAQGIGGLAPGLTKLGLEGLGPWSLVVVRQLLAATFLGGLLLFGGRLRGTAAAGPRSPWSARDLALLLLLSWAGFALPQVLGALGVRLSTATHGALLIPLEPIGIMLGGALLLGEPLTRDRVGALVLGVLGATAIVLSSASSLAGGSVRGDVLIALGHLSWAIYTLAAKPLLVRHDPLRISLFAAVASIPPLLPLAAGEAFDAARFGPALGWILLLAFLGSAVGPLAWNRALRELKAGTVASFIFVQPLVGLLLGVLGLGEPVGALALLGAALIVGGIGLTAAGERRRAPAGS